MHDYKASILIPKLDCNSLRITAYSDAEFVNSVGSFSQLEQISLLTEDSHNSIPVSYKSHKSRRAAHFVLSAEVIAFVDLFYDARKIRKALGFVLWQLILVHILTNSKSSCKILSKSRSHEREADCA